MATEHQCDPEPKSPQDEIPIQWTCPECGQVWVPDMPKGRGQFPPPPGAEEPYWSWTWARRVA